MKVVIIGAGLGGLECARMLVKHGVEVVVLEQQHQAGGCIQSFKRNGVCLDTGFHYVGGLDSGEHLWHIFDELDLNGLPWKAMDRDGFDHVYVNDREYRLPMGHMAYCKRLKEYFPGQEQSIEEFVSMMRKTGDSIFMDNGIRERMLSTSAYDALHDLFSDETLIQVVSGASMKMDLDPDHLPLYSFLQINDSYIRGAYRLKGGGSKLVEKLCYDIEEMGGSIITCARVTGIDVSGQRVKGIEAVLREDDTFYIDNPDWVISDIDPSTTFGLMRGASLRGVFLRRLAGMPVSRGMFTASLILKRNTLPYRNHNIFIHSDGNVWHRDARKVRDVMIHYPVTDTDEPTQIDLLSPMSWSVVDSMNRAGYSFQRDYLSMKQRWTNDIIELASTQLPDLSESIDRSYSSTPLTYHRYNSVREGAAFGIARDWHKGPNSIISTSTPIENLMLTGQNLMLHGILGVSVTAMDTVSGILRNINPRYQLYH